MGLAAFLGADKTGLVGPGLAAVAEAGAMSLKFKVFLAMVVLLLASAGIWKGLALPRSATPQGEAARPTVQLIAAPDADSSVPVQMDSNSASRELLGGQDFVNVTRATGSLRLSMRWFDQTPAEDVYAKIIPANATTENYGAFYVRMDESGSLLIEHLAVGSVRVCGQRGDFQSVDVRAGNESSATLVLHRGMDLHGRVTTLDGTAVADAEIWLSDPGNATEGVAVTRSGPDGRFFLRSITDQHCFGAHKAGHGPSPLRWIEGSVGEAQETELILQGSGSFLSIRVVGPDDQPVPFATVRVMESLPDAQGYAPGTPPRQTHRTM